MPFHMSAPARSSKGSSPQVSPPGSPGRAITSVCQRNSPVRTSWALTKHFCSMKLPQPLTPLITFPSAMIGPAVFPKPIR